MKHLFAPRRVGKPGEGASPMRHLFAPRRVGKPAANDARSLASEGRVERDHAQQTERAPANDAVQAAKQPTLRRRRLVLHRVVCAFASEFPRPGSAAGRPGTGGARPASPGPPANTPGRTAHLTGRHLRDPGPACRAQGRAVAYAGVGFSSAGLPGAERLPKSTSEKSSATLGCLRNACLPHARISRSASST
jgi:hypothetical protein